MNPTEYRSQLSRRRQEIVLVILNSLHLLSGIPELRSRGPREDASGTSGDVFIRHHTPVLLYMLSIILLIEH